MLKREGRNPEEWAGVLNTRGGSISKKWRVSVWLHVAEKLAFNFPGQEQFMLGGKSYWNVFISILEERNQSLGHYSRSIAVNVEKEK